MTAPTQAASGAISERALALRMFRTYLAPRWRGLALAMALAVFGGILTAALTGILNPVVRHIFEEKRASRPSRPGSPTASATAWWARSSWSCSAS